MSSMAQCSSATWGNWQNLLSLFSGVTPQPIWGTSCNWDNLNEDLYIRITFNPSQYLPASMWSTATANSTATPTATATSTFAKSYATLVNAHYPGGYYPGGSNEINDLRYWEGPFSACPAQCDSTPGCVGFLLHKNLGANCYLKFALHASKSTWWTGSDTVYVTNQAALRVRLAAKDEV
jgi:hypothetical protein